MFCVTDMPFIYVPHNIFCQSTLGKTDLFLLITYVYFNFVLSQTLSQIGHKLICEIVNYFNFFGRQLTIKFDVDKSDLTATSKIQSKYAPL